MPRPPQPGVPGRRTRGALIALTAVGALLLLLLPRQLQDLDVYRAGGLALLHGRDPYRVVSGPARLGFTYPPFASVLAITIGALPRFVGALLLFVGDVAALGMVHRWLRPRIGESLRTANRPAAQAFWSAMGQPATFICATLLVIEPVRSSTAYGQVNLILLGLVVTDLTAPATRRTAGILTGTAAAVKLTPLIFLCWLIGTGQLKTAARAACAFVVAGLAAAAVAPGVSRAYWEHYVTDSSRIGSAAYGSNQALSGLLARSEHVAAPRGPATVALTLAMLGLGLAVSVAWFSRDRDLSLCLAALTGLVVSPISWSHHWVWMAPAGMILLGRSERTLRSGGGALLAVTLLATPSWWERGGVREVHRGWLDVVFGETYLFAAVATVGIAAFAIVCLRMPLDSFRIHRIERKT